MILRTAVFLPEMMFLLEVAFLLKGYPQHGIFSSESPHDSVSSSRNQTRRYFFLGGIQTAVFLPGAVQTAMTPWANAYTYSLYTVVLSSTEWLTHRNSQHDVHVAEWTLLRHPSVRDSGITTCTYSYNTTIFLQLFAKGSQRALGWSVWTVSKKHNLDSLQLKSKTGVFTKNK